MKIKVIIFLQAGAEGLTIQGSEDNEDPSAQFEKIVKEVLYSLQ